MAPAVLSVEGFSLSIANGVASAAGTLTLGQVLANCIVLLSATVASDVNSSLYLDAELTTGPDAVTVSRIGTTGACAVRAWVVEFDPAEVTVQQGTFTVAAASATGATAITLVDRTAAFVTAYYKTTDVLDDNDSGHVRFRIEADSNGVEFARSATDGDVTGHFFVAEALNGAWTVQNLAANSSANGVLDQEIAIGTPVDTALAFCIASFNLATGSDLAVHLPNVGIEDTDNLQVSRFDTPVAPNAAFTVWAQVIEFADSTVGNVQHGLFSALAGAASDTDAINAVDLDRSITVAGPALYGGRQSDGGSGSRSQVFGRLTFGSATTITGDRGGTTGDWELYWQAVEWELVEDEEPPAATAGTRRQRRIAGLKRTRRCAAA